MAKRGRRGAAAADPEKLAEAIKVLEEIVRLYPDTLLAKGATAAIKLRNSKLILESADVMRYRLDHPPTGKERWPL